MLASGDAFGKGAKADGAPGGSARSCGAGDAAAAGPQSAHVPDGELNLDDATLRRAVIFIYFVLDGEGRTSAEIVSGIEHRSKRDMTFQSVAEHSTQQSAR